MRIPGKISTHFVIALFLSLFSLSVASCSNNSDSNQNTAPNQNTNSNTNSQAVKDDIAELGTVINFPEQPEESVWREDNVNGKGKKLTAVLKYGNDGLQKIVSSAEKHKPAAQAEIGVEDWFPEELTAQSQLSGNESLKGTAYGANDFFTAQYKNGKLVRVQDTNYFVLELTTY